MSTRALSMVALSMAALVAGVLLGAGEAAADTRRYAVVVAHAEDIRGRAAPLEFADDDGARYYELLSRVADQVELFTVLDPDSQRLYPEAASRSRPPRHREVLAGLERVFDAMDGDIRGGHEVVFYFVLIGHGDVGAGGEGYVSLLDAPFTRTDLFQRVLARSPATTNHVIVDACSSYFMVHRRGGEDDTGPSRRQAVRSFLAREELGRYPNTGVLLSTSSAKDSHEWSAYSAGVFSHQVRSALAGGADVNSDGVIAYSEVEAFIAAANAAIDNPRARVEVYAQGPAMDLARPLVDLRGADFRHWLKLPRGRAQRLYLEDARGVRYLDVHASGERDVVLGLVDSPYYYVRSGDSAREARVELAVPGRIDFDPADMTSAAMVARGAVAESFRLALFAAPYGPSFYRGYVASAGLVPVADGAEVWMPERAAVVSATAPALAVQPPEVAPARGTSAAGLAGPTTDGDGSGGRRHVAAWTLTATAAVLAAGGAWALWHAHDQEQAFAAAHIDPSGMIVGISPVEARRTKDRMRAWSVAGGVLLAGAGAAGVGATILFLRDSDDGARPAGVAVGGSF